MSTKSEAYKPGRAVFDTNILISAYLWPGVPRRALEIIRSGQCVLFSSTNAIRELVRVLGYPKFGFSAAEIAPIVNDLTTLVTLVNPRKQVSIIKKDPTDNTFLSIAIEAACSYIVSGDRHLLDLGSYEGVHIVKASEFMQTMRGEKA